MKLECLRRNTNPVIKAGLILSIFIIISCGGGGGQEGSGTGDEKITATPTFDPSTGIVPSSGGLEVTINCSTAGSVIYYTTDGKDPETTGASYPAGYKLTLTRATLLKAIAACDGYQKSAVQSNLFYRYMHGINMVYCGQFPAGWRLG